MNKILSKFGYLIINQKYLRKKYQLKSNFNPLEQLFHRKLHDNFFFLQIGANNGVRFDPIYHLVTSNPVKGLVIEPIKEYYNELEKNYAEFPKIIPVNLAIHQQQRTVTMYKVKDGTNKYPEWAKGIASFNPEHHKKSGIASEDIGEETVEAVRLDELIKRYDITHIDLLQIDTEGYDYKILKMLNLDEIKPEIISFEHSILDAVMTYEQLFEIQERLIQKGYNFIMLNQDAIAYRR